VLRAAVSHDYERFARWYDDEYDARTDDLPMWERFAHEAGACLELACGTGRCAIALARAGVRVVGIDLSPEMIEIGRAKVEAAALGDRVDLRLGDMRDFDLDRTFPLVIVPFGSLMCLATRDDQRATIACAARHLSAGGRLVIDVFNPDVDMPPPEIDGKQMVCCTRTLPTGEHRLHARTMTHDRAAGVLHVREIFRETDANGSTVTSIDLPLLYVRADPLERMARDAGLEIDDVFGTYALDPFTPSSPRIVLVARRTRS
jgi:SAM-dependent methyltransferase